MLTLQVTTLLLVAVGCSALAQLALKLGMGGQAVQAALAGGGGAVPVVQAIMGSAGVWIGLSLYGCSAILWLFVLARVDLSVAYAFVSLGFLLVMILGAVVFAEPVTARKLAGTLLVAGGIWLVASGVRPQATIALPGPAASRAAEARGPAAEPPGSRN